MEPNTIFMWTAGAAATITSALAIRAAWTQYNAAIADANTLRFQLERAHTLVDQMTDQVASMNRTIGELRSCLLYTSPSPRDYAASRMPSSA